MKPRHSILIPFALMMILMIAILVIILLLMDHHPVLVRILLVFLVGLVLFAAAIFYTRIYVPLFRIGNMLHMLSRGKLPAYRTCWRKDETGVLEEQLVSHIRHITSLLSYAEGLAEDREVGEITLRGDDDEMGRVIRKLQSHMFRTRREMVERHRQDEQQNWAAQGLARFSQLLRNTEENTETMSGLFIRELVKYLEVEVGGLFLMSREDEPLLYMSGAYAFDRNKQVNRKFRPGEGLVGRCAIEKEKIVITEIPPEYIRIRSGLGEDQPAALVLVPILMDNQVLGVIEVASFSEIPGYKIEFLESLAANIASTLLRLA